jgi:hypothetical protein
MSSATIPTFAMVSTNSLAELCKAKAPASAVLVWSALVSFDFHKRGKCFPKISTIKQLLGGEINERKIYWAINWLRNAGFLKTNKRTSSNRFDLSLRKQTDFAKQYAKPEPATHRKQPATDDSRREKPKRERKPFFNKRRSVGLSKEKQATLDREKAITRYCEDVAGFIMAINAPNWPHPIIEPAKPMFPLEELHTELLRPDLLLYNQVGASKIWDWIKKAAKEF